MCRQVACLGLVGWLVECLFEYTYTYPLETVLGFPKVLFVSSTPIPENVARLGAALHRYRCYQSLLVSQTDIALFIAFDERLVMLEYRTREGNCFKYKELSSAIDLVR